MYKPLAWAWPLCAAPFPSCRPWLGNGDGHCGSFYATRWNAKTESKNYPAFTNAIQLLEHSQSIGAGGIQVVVGGWTQDFAKKVRDSREKLGLYLEGSIGLPKVSADVATFEKKCLPPKKQVSRFSVQFV
nr:hypothetical protein [Haliscomenobacter sp.]